MHFMPFAGITDAADLGTLGLNHYSTIYPGSQLAGMFKVHGAPWSLHGTESRRALRTSPGQPISPKLPCDYLS